MGEIDLTSFYNYLSVESFLEISKKYIQWLERSLFIECSMKYKDLDDKRSYSDLLKDVSNDDDFKIKHTFQYFIENVYKMEQK